MLPCRGDSPLERMRILERSWDGVREGPGEKRRSHDARASGVGGSPCRAKALDTCSALDHGSRAGLKKATATATDHISVAAAVALAVKTSG